MPSWRAGARRRRRTRGTTQRDEIDAGGAEQIVPRLQGAAALEAPPRRRARPGRARRRGRRLRRSFDADHGGWGGAPKFPAASVIEFLLARGERAMPLQTLRAMASRRHLRPGRRRLRALLGRRALARAALREDALRQRAAGPRVPARLAGDAASRCSGACARRRSTGRCASCARTRAGSRPRWTPTPRASRAGSTSGRRTRSARRSAPSSPTRRIAHFGVTEAGNFEGAEHPRCARRPTRRELRERSRRGLLAARASAGAARRSTTSG